mmetsp:Transcript_3764/g.23674  ORF Transcript_3764/g.23674 Transcript_3764/m.23674 type:complete len:236 (-) Transcript_3764:2234-2941(-)
MDTSFRSITGSSFPESTTRTFSPTLRRNSSFSFASTNVVSSSEAVTSLMLGDRLAARTTSISRLASCLANGSAPRTASAPALSTKTTALRWWRRHAASSHHAWRYASMSSTIHGRSGSASHVSKNDSTDPLVDSPSWKARAEAVAPRSNVFPANKPRTSRSIWTRSSCTWSNSRSKAGSIRHACSFCEALTSRKMSSKPCTRKARSRRRHSHRQSSVGSGFGHQSGAHAAAASHS